MSDDRKIVIGIGPAAGADLAVIAHKLMDGGFEVQPYQRNVIDKLERGLMSDITRYSIGAWDQRFSFVTSPLLPRRTRQACRRSASARGRKRALHQVGMVTSQRIRFARFRPRTDLVFAQQFPFHVRRPFDVVLMGSL